VRKRRAFLHPGGSSLVMNVVFPGPTKRLQRHQLDYTIQWPELRSVGFTAAVNEIPDLQEVDATEASLISGQMRAVSAPLSLAVVWFLRRPTSPAHRYGVPFRDATAELGRRDPFTGTVCGG